MRTESPDSPRSAFDRMRSRFAQFGTWLADRPYQARWGLGIGAVVIIAALIYLAIPTEPTTIAWLESGKAFSGEHYASVVKALASEGIIYRRDGQGRIGVAAEKLREAQTALTKHKVKIDTVNTLFEIERDVLIMDGPAEREQRSRGSTEKSLQAMIEDIDNSGIETASVKIHRIVDRVGIRPQTNVSVTVYVTTQNKRSLSGETVQAIQAFSRLMIPELKPTAVNLVDRQGREYLSSKNPTAEVMSLTKAREEKLSDGIAEKLDFIPGVKVTVRIDPPPAPIPTVAIKSVLPPEPFVRPNHPIEITPPGAADSVGSMPPQLVEMTAMPQGKARVLVQVPRSFYLREFRAANRRDPSPEDLGPYINKIRLLVDSAVSMMFAPKEGDVHIDMIPDEIEPLLATGLTAASDERRVAPWWLPVGAMVAAGLVLSFAAVGARSLRRPALRSIVPAPHARFDAAEIAGPGPSERVRDLIRRNPTAAAGVLQRWIGQGGRG